MWSPKTKCTRAGRSLNLLDYLKTRRTVEISKISGKGWNHNKPCPFSHCMQPHLAGGLPESIPSAEVCKLVPKARRHRQAAGNPWIQETTSKNKNPSVTAAQTVLGSKEFTFKILSTASPRQELPRVPPYASISRNGVPKSWPSHGPSCKATVTSHSWAVTRHINILSWSLLSTVNHVEACSKEYYTFGAACLAENLCMFSEVCVGGTKIHSKNMQEWYKKMDSNSHASFDHPSLLENTEAEPPLQSGHAMPGKTFLGQLKKPLISYLHFKKQLRFGFVLDWNCFPSMLLLCFEHCQISCGNDLERQTNSAVLQASPLLTSVSSLHPFRSTKQSREFKISISSALPSTTVPGVEAVKTVKTDRAIQTIKAVKAGMWPVTSDQSWPVSEQSNEELAAARNRRTLDTCMTSLPWKLDLGFVSRFARKGCCDCGNSPWPFGSFSLIIFACLRIFTLWRWFLLFVRRFSLKL